MNVLRQCALANHSVEIADELLRAALVGYVKIKARKVGVHARFAAGIFSGPGWRAWAVGDKRTP